MSWTVTAYSQIDGSVREMHYFDYEVEAKRLRRCEVKNENKIFLKIIFLLLISGVYGFIFYKAGQISIEKNIIIYQVDNAGGVMFGKISDKEIIDGRYTVTAGAYGKFLVTEEQYNEITVGDDIPDYLKGRGN